MFGGEDAALSVNQTHVEFKNQFTRQCLYPALLNTLFAYGSELQDFYLRMQTFGSLNNAFI